MRGELLIAAGPGEWRAAWVEDGTAAELYVERGLSHPSGSVVLGRVVRLAPSLDAALVDIGEERPGFLPVRAGERPHEGARVVVQVRREAQNAKGAYLTTRLAEPALVERAEGLVPPLRLAPGAGFAAALAARLPAPPDRVQSSDASIIAELRRNFPDSGVGHAAIDTWPLDIDAVFDEALSQAVTLPGGGTIHFAETRAGVMVDIDTGTPDNGSAARTALAANMTAVAALARQLRLRQLGGAIVVDFAAAEGARLRERIKVALHQALAGDPAKPQALGWTRLGHFEIVRPRRGRSLADLMLDRQTGAKSDLTRAFEALRELHGAARARPAAKWRLTANPGIAAALRGAAAPALAALQSRLGRTITIETWHAAMPPAFDIAAL